MRTGQYMCVTGTYMNCVDSRLATAAALGSPPYDYCTLQQVCMYVRTHSPGGALLCSGPSSMHTHEAPANGLPTPATSPWASYPGHQPMGFLPRPPAHGLPTPATSPWASYPGHQPMGFLPRPPAHGLPPHPDLCVAGGQQALIVRPAHVLHWAQVP